ncbi:MAG TPA: TonB-dependent receptor [Bacteroidales bacterium]|nr:TonB-dependent receptor [Bacteroidales bacterium]HPS17487.1 TonB-dependent receptor [Bacteroidales bacterium]
MRKLLFIFFLLPLFGITQSGQKTIITGTVFDANDNAPLFNASIVLKNKNIGTASDKNGNFSLPGIETGTYILNVSFLGYQSVQKKVEVKNEPSIHVKIFLKDTSFTSRELEIIANREKDILDQSNRVSIISAKSITTIPAQNINGIINYSSGINSSNISGIFSSKAIVTMRGLPSNDQSRTLVLLDGIPLNKSDEGSVNWNMINKNNIEEIKIIKGPGSAKYGSGAMGGVIELISKKPSKKLEGNIITEYGTFNTMSSNINLAGIIKPDSSKDFFYWGITGFGRKSDGYITLPEQYRTIDDTTVEPTFLKEINASLKTGYSFRKNQNIELQLSYYDDMRGNGFKVFDYYGAYQQHQTYNGTARYSGNFGYFKWNTNVYNITENYHRIYEYMKEMTYQLYEANSEREDRGGAVDVSFLKYKKHEISGGLSCKYGRVDGSDTYYTSTDIIRNAGKMDSYALYLQDQVNLLNDKAQVNAGLRYDFANFHDGLFTIDDPSYSIIFYENFEDASMPSKHWNALCPRFSAQYKFSKTSRAYISIAKGFRAPILDDMCRTGKKHGGFKVANPDLKPELITTYETGGDMELMKNFKANASVYYSVGHDFMYYTSTGDSVNVGYARVPIFKKQNIGKVELYGTEVEFKYNLNDSLNIFANYTYTHAQIIEDNILNSKVDSNLTGKYLTDIPDHTASAGITWRNKIVNTSVLFKYIGKTWINEWNIVDVDYFKTDKFPDYGTFNIRLEKQFFKGLSASFSVENIFNKKYINSNLEQCAGRFISFTIKYSL